MKKYLILGLVLLFVLTGCKSETESHSSKGTTGSFSAVFTENKAEKLQQIQEGIFIDIEHISEGYFSLLINLEGKYKVEIDYQNEEMYFDVINEEVCSYGFTFGQGEYDITILKNIVDNKYVSVISQSVDVELLDEFQPFIRSSFIINYNENSSCVKQAKQLASESENDADFVNKVHDSICKRLKYDNVFAKNVERGYKPDIEKVWENKKGICYDYAVLACSMLRSNGVPCKLIIGYLNGDIYHAWNMVYLKDEGWVTYQYFSDSTGWSRVDLTIDDSNSIFTGKNVYTTSYIY